MCVKIYFLLDCTFQLLFICKIQILKYFSETDDVDGGVLSSETILRGVTGREVLEELQVGFLLQQQTPDYFGEYHFDI